MTITPNDLTQIREAFTDEAGECLTTEDLHLHHDPGDVTYDGPCGVQTERGLYPSTWSEGSGRIVVQWPQEAPVSVQELEGLIFDSPAPLVGFHDGDEYDGDFLIYCRIEQACVDFYPGHPDGAWHVTAVFEWEGGTL